MADHHAHSHGSSRPAPDLVEDGIPATSEAPPGLDVDAVEGEAAPLDHPQGVDQWGTTAAEELLGEPFELRVAHEQPDTIGAFDDIEIEEALGNEDSLSAEESALRVVDEPPGMSYAPDPGYLSDDG
ncbi:MAG TPA: hypothetical protein VHM89_14860 [Acidimicrobiales bacterium]|nr:hypothetical protein [Acidimicrobiales bacterium]